MKPYTWAVMKDCRLVGYVRSFSERDALDQASKQFGDRLFVERVYLGEQLPEGQDILARSEQ